MRTYLAIIRKESGSDFGVNFPDFPGLATGGRTLEEARAAAAEALALHVAGMIEDGETVPAPSDLDAVMADPENRDGVAVLVPLERPKGRVARVNITLEESLLAEIDATAAASGMTRSGFLAVAAAKAIGAAGHKARRKSA